MALQAAHIDSLFLVRWDLPSADSCARVRAAFKARGGRTKPFYVAVLPPDMPALGHRERRRLVELTQDLLPFCAHVAVVIEARGSRGAALRDAMSAVKLSSAAQYGLSMVGSIDRALVWAPGPLPEARELRLVLEAAGCALSPASGLARRRIEPMKVTPGDSTTRAA